MSAIDQVSLKASNVAVGGANQHFFDSSTAAQLTLRTSGAELFRVVGNVTATDTVTANAANINGALTAVSGSVTGGFTVGGNLTVNGTVTTINTETQVTDQLLVTNAGTGPAIVARQNGTEDVATFMDDANVVMRVYDGGFVAIGAGSSNSLNTTTKVSGARLYVAGNVLTTDTITAPTFSGNLTGGTVSGTGTGLTDLNASNISTGTLAVAQGGTGTTTSTGTGSVVLNTAPVLSGLTVVGDINANNFIGNITGNISASNATVSGILTVSGTTAKGAGNVFSYMNYHEANGIQLGTDTSALTVSISATSGAVQAAQFVAMSDKRIKTDISEELAPQTLAEKVAAIPVRTWKYRDVVAQGSQERLGFLAQDIRDAGLTHAVRTSPGYLPNVYKTAIREDKTTFTLENHGLGLGTHRVQLIEDDIDGTLRDALLEVVDADSVLIPTARSDSVFVYGTYCQDILSLDYDAITAAAIGAIQELQNRVEKLEQQLDERLAVGRSPPTMDPVQTENSRGCSVQ